MRAFAQAERFVSEVEARKLRPVYVFVGDEVFFRKKCRDAVLQSLVPNDLREFSLFEFDLGETDLAEVLDRARTPSLMAPFQVFFVRGVKNLFGRGSKEERLAAIEEYCNNPNPDALVVFVADHISIPADVRKMEMQDKERYQRIRDVMGQYCGMVELARVEEGDAVRWITDYSDGCGVKIECDAARELHNGDEWSRDRRQRNVHLTEGAGHPAQHEDKQLLRSVGDEDDTNDDAKNGESQTDPLCRHRGNACHGRNLVKGDGPAIVFNQPGILVTPARACRV